MGNDGSTGRKHAVTVVFSIGKTDRPRLDYLADVFADGNRSAFLRLAIERMEVIDRAQRLRSIQSYGAQLRKELDIAPEETSERVKKVLARKVIS